MTYALLTMGCKLNQTDSAQLAGRLGGAANALKVEQADLVFLNTCTVTLNGDSDSRQMIRRHSVEFRQYPHDHYRPSSRQFPIGRKLRCPNRAKTIMQDRAGIDSVLAETIGKHPESRMN